MRNYTAALCLLLAGVAQAAGRPARPTIDSLRLTSQACPIKVDEECRARCGGSGAPAQPACRWSAFGCDFKVCWGSRQRVIRDDLVSTLADPDTYASGPTAPIAGGVNLISLIRLVHNDLPGLFLVRGQFVLELPALSPPAQAKALIRWAQACATRAMDSQPGVLDRSAESAAPLRVTNCSGAVRLAAIRPTTPPPSEAVLPDPKTAAPRGQDEAALTAVLTRSGIVRVDGPRILVDGSPAFSPSDRPEQQMAALARLSNEETAALKELHERFTRRAIDEAGRRQPAPEGQAYIYDPASGEAVLRPSAGGAFIPGGFDPHLK